MLWGLVFLSDGLSGRFASVGARLAVSSVSSIVYFKQPPQITVRLRCGALRSYGFSLDSCTLVPFDLCVKYRLQQRVTLWHHAADVHERPCDARGGVATREARTVCDRERLQADAHCEHADVPH